MRNKENKKMEKLRKDSHFNKNNKKKLREINFL